MAREVGAETFEANEETAQRHVEASSPPQGLREDGEVDLNVEVSNFLYLHHTRSFFNNKFNVSGKMYTIRVDDRPEVAEHLDAFNAVLSEHQSAKDSVASCLLCERSIAGIADTGAASRSVDSHVNIQVPAVYKL